MLYNNHNMKDIILDIIHYTQVLMCYSVHYIICILLIIYVCYILHIHH